jgi:hypothetical protein
VQFFTDRGYPTEIRDGRQTGFFHGTGHGLGLEIHEHPRFQKTVFKIGQVLTVEPGLYYPGLGGVRTEDVVAVTKRGIRMLSRFENRLEIERHPERSAAQSRDPVTLPFSLPRGTSTSLGMTWQNERKTLLRV